MHTHIYIHMCILIRRFQGKRSGSMVKSTCLIIPSTYMKAHKSSVMPVPRDLMPSSVLCRNTNGALHAGKASIHITKRFLQVIQTVNIYTQAKTLILKSGCKFRIRDWERGLFDHFQWIFILFYLRQGLDPQSRMTLIAYSTPGSSIFRICLLHPPEGLIRDTTMTSHRCFNVKVSVKFPISRLHKFIEENIN